MPKRQAKILKMVNGIELRYCIICEQFQTNKEFKGIRCKECYKAYMRQYRIDKRVEIKAQRKQYRADNKVKLKREKAEYHQRNKIEISNRLKKKRKENPQRFTDYNRKQYTKDIAKSQKRARDTYRSNKEKDPDYNRKKYAKRRDKSLASSKKWARNNRSKVNTAKRKYDRERRTNDPAYRLKGRISRAVYAALKNNGSSKQGMATWEEMPYTPQILIEHLEKQFVKHMSWTNWGAYNLKTHNDNDPSTWTWQIDHIVPLSDLPFTSMKDENFKKAWALENLRPLWAKQNVIDGASRVRHKSKHKSPKSNPTPRKAKQTK